MDSKISAYRHQQQTQDQMPMSGRHLSNEIQLFSSTESIWLGHTSTHIINVKMKLGKIFFTDPLSNTSCFSLSAHLQNDQGRVIGQHDNAASAKGEASTDQPVSFAFLTSDGVSVNPSAEAVGRYSSLQVHIPNKLSFADDAFRVAVEAKGGNGKEVIFGTTHIIRVAEYCVEVDRVFSNNQQMEYNYLGCADRIAWYSKNPNSSIGVYVRIRNSKNQIKVSEPLQIRAILEYENGLAAPESVNEPWPEKVKPQLFRPLSTNPFIAKRNSESILFCFRISEVSFHHPAQMGFKIKMVAVPMRRNSSLKTIHPGLLKESITVLSRNKTHDSRVTRSLPHKKRILASISQQHVDNSAPKRSNQKAGKKKPNKSSQLPQVPASISIDEGKENMPQKIKTGGKLAPIQEGEQQVETSAPKRSKRKAGSSEPKKTSKPSFVTTSIGIEENQKIHPKNATAL